MNPSGDDLNEDEHFFAKLPEVQDFDQVFRREDYADAPGSWFVIITDVRGSTRAIAEGRYREVNAVGVASIIAVRNAVPDLELPYVFGGDGATLLVPGSRCQAVYSALRGARELARSSFDLDLRVGSVSVAELRARGHAVRVERYRSSPHVALAMFSGAGFPVAEGWVKDQDLGTRYAIPDGPADASFEGFECRWQPMESQRGAMVCLLVVALGTDDTRRENTYRRVLAQLEQILTNGVTVPVSPASLRTLPPWADFSVEARIRSGQRSGGDFNRARSRARNRAAIGSALMAFGARAGGFDGKSYPEEFIANTDFRKFDETLRMVLDLTLEESTSLEEWLARAAAQGELAFGLHRSKAAIATCMIKAYRGDHVHFIDGSDGGYALAARALKQALAARDG